MSNNSQSQFTAQFAEMSKMFSPEYMQTMVQQFTPSTMDMTGAITTSKQTMESMKKAANVMSDCWSACMEQSLQSLQTSMNEYIGAMKEMSTAQGVEEVMSKQSMLSQKMTDLTQETSKKVSTTMQKGQTEAFNIMSKQFLDNMQTMQKTVSSTTPTSKTSK